MSLKTIIIEQRYADFMAYLEGNPGVRAAGKNIYEAIGDLLVHHPEHFTEGGIRIAYDESTFVNGRAAAGTLTISADMLQKGDVLLSEGQERAVRTVSKLDDRMTIYFDIDWQNAKRADRVTIKKRNFGTRVARGGSMSEFETWTKGAFELDPGDVIVRSGRNLRVFKVEQSGEGVKVETQDTLDDSLHTLRYGIGDDVLILNT